MRRRHTWVLVATTIAATASLVTVADAGRPPAPAVNPASPTPGGHVTISGDAEVSNPWTPAAMRCDSYCYTRARTFFDQLAVFGDDGQVHGMLAESIEPNDDYTEWTLKIREGISFTDGSPVNAAAVIYNLQATGTGVLIGALVKDIAKVPDPNNPDRMLLDIEQLDDLTFVIRTGDDGDPDRPIPWRNFPHTLTGQWGLIASPFWLAEVAENPELATQPVGSGPFVVDSYEPRGSLEVSRNPDYWMTDAEGNQLPYLDSISFRVIEDSEIAVEALQSGDVDIMTTSNGRAISTVQGLGDEFAIALQDDYIETYYLLPDLDKAGPLQDQRVRCAMSMAIDRQEFVDATSNSFNTPANGLFSPGQQGHLDDNGLALEQDLDAAAALISEYEEETGTEVAFTLGHIPSNVVVQAAELLMGWWSNIGIDVDSQTIPQNDFINLAVFGTPEFEVFLWRQHTGVFIDQQYLWWHSENAFPDGSLSLNFGRLRDPDIDAGLDAARRSTSDEEAIAAAEDVNRAFAAGCHYIPIAWLAWGVLSDPAVQGIGGLTLPDGQAVIDGSASAGAFWTHTLSVAEG